MRRPPHARAWTKLPRPRSSRSTPARSHRRRGADRLVWGSVWNPSARSPFRLRSHEKAIKLSPGRPNRPSSYDRSKAIGEPPRGKNSSANISVGFATAGDCISAPTLIRDRRSVGPLNLSPVSWAPPRSVGREDDHLPNALAMTSAPPAVRQDRRNGFWLQTQ